MFTGIIEELGTVEALDDARGRRAAEGALRHRARRPGGGRQHRW